MEEPPAVSMDGVVAAAATATSLGQRDGHQSDGGGGGELGGASKDGGRTTDDGPQDDAPLDGDSDGGLDDEAEKGASSEDAPGDDGGEGGSGDGDGVQQPLDVPPGADLWNLLAEIGGRCEELLFARQRPQTRVAGTQQVCVVCACECKIPLQEISCGRVYRV